MPAGCGQVQCLHPVLLQETNITARCNQLFRDRRVSILGSRVEGREPIVIRFFFKESISTIYYSITRDRKYENINQEKYIRMLLKYDNMIQDCM